MIDTREHALGLFQQTMAIASSQKRRAFRFLTNSENVSRSSALINDPQATSEGAGVGFGVADFRISQVSRGGGKRRLFHIFNAVPWSRNELVELVVWDWTGDLNRLVVENENGKSLLYQIVDQGRNKYWGHDYLRILVQAETPACGHGSVILSESEAILNSKKYPLSMRTVEPTELCLENECLKATFDIRSCALVSLLDKTNGEELVDPRQPANFRRIQEDVQEMTAWVVGRYKEFQSITKDVRLLKKESKGPLRDSFTYEAHSKSSKLTVTVSLAARSRRLEYAVECDWHEIGRKGEGVPQLNFCLPLAQPVRSYLYDIPFGVVERPPLALDVPGNSWGAAVPQGDGPTVQIISEGTYGFRGTDNSLALTLIRSSFDPDPYPEVGIHNIRFALTVITEPSSQDLIANAAEYCLPLDVYSAAGKQPTQFGFLNQESGSANLAAIKAPEDGEANTLILRMYESDGQPTNVSMRFAQSPLEAAWVNIHEQPTGDTEPLQIDGNRLMFTLQPYCLRTIRIRFT